MVTSSILEGEMDFELEDPGSFKFRAFGATNEDVSMKKMSNRKIMSVKEDMLNFALTFVLFFSAIKYFVDALIR